MANFMQVSISIPKLQFFKLLKSVILNIYNCEWNPVNTILQEICKTYKIMH